ncbi:hypothetical protein ACKZDW_21875 [Ralstonia syzygii subsp. celebesensis]|uniref:Amidohydrolase n=2 Tax=Ralstonia syzygii subsp. celebesensis TaxID=1310168 RepID=A0A1U9VFH5_9RALS|nr:MULTISPECIES: hypothetical protein [Ralstonia solanacearum species complex]AQW29306.1 hypothetical protein B0B51_04345 [blood disease bacterium A2-HR MARDI]QQV56820.1 hypothetical protein JK151_07805 [Ralstonia syzygii subsp. celebesensis]CBJ50315.1 exported protein of unknown function [Ralstonia solanacearum PSI07]CCA79641.1 conserved exported hypothetical protein [blood disease bacterium R229]
MTTRPIRLKRTGLTWPMVGAALLALAQTPSVLPGNTAVAAADGGIDVAQRKPAVEAAVNADDSHLDALYKDLQRIRMLAFQETRTAARLAAEMRKIGFDVTETVGKTGVEAMSLTVMPALQWNQTANPSS